MNNNQSNKQRTSQQQRSPTNLPTVRSEDVEFATDAADQEDTEAVQRANAADQRQE
jgi:hypothetical protein